jgi:hypothetical protein
MRELTIEAWTQEIFVNPVTGAIAVIHAGPQGPAGAGAEDVVLLDSNQTVDGTKTFTTSPVVPNPVVVAGPTKAVSYGEVTDLIAAEASLIGADTLYRGKFGNIPLFGAVTVGNTTTETSLIDTPPTIPAMPGGSTGKIIIAGNLRNSSGSTKTLTLRFKEAGTPIHSFTVDIPTDADTARPFKFELNLQNLNASNANIYTDFFVDAGTTAAAIHALAETALATQGASPATWNITAQWSAASSTTTIQRTLANLEYSLGI